MRLLSGMIVVASLAVAGSASAHVGINVALARDAQSKSPTAPAEELTLSLPTGWEQQSGWYIRTLPDDGGRVARALVRFPAKVTPSGSMSDALRRLWTTEIPAEGKDRASGVVFRRFVGDQLLTQFIGGAVREKDRLCDTFFSLYLIDCKTYWQPVVVALTYDSPHAVSIEMSAGGSYPQSMAEAEKLLATFRCPSAKTATLVDSASLVGDYQWGSGSFFSGFTPAGTAATDHMSRRGQLNLRKNGSFEYRYSSAGGRDGNTNFAGAKGDGKWTIEGDVLVCKYANYNQGDSYNKKEHRYRIASVCTFPNGAKLAVLIQDLDQKINMLTVNDASTWYWTGDPNKK